MRKRELVKRRQSTMFERHNSIGYFSCLDAIEATRCLRDESIDLVFLDPPFNLNKDYGEALVPEHSSPKEYKSYLTRLLADLVRTLKPGGAFYMYNLPYWSALLFPRLNEILRFRHWIAISMKNGFVRGPNLYPAHYALLYFTKGDPGIFNRPRIQPLMCKSCDGFAKDYGGYKSIIEEKGVNLSDFWDDISPVRHRSRKLRASNQLPLELTDRVISMSGSPGGILYDPFVGTGTSLVSATNAGMRFIANDYERENLTICKERLSSAAGK